MHYCTFRALNVIPRLRIVAIVASLISLGSLSVLGQSMPGFQAPDRTAVKEDIRVKAARGQAPLSKRYDQLKAEPSKVKRLPKLNWREKNKQTTEKLLRIGVVRQLTSPLDPISESTLYHVPEGDVRVAAVVSAGALRVRVHFNGMSLPEGARVFVYSMSSSADFCGPYEGHGPSEDGTFWTPPLAGEGVVIEYFTPKGTTSGNVPFRISEVSHIYKDLPTLPDAAGACNLEVTAAWANVAKSVGMLDFVSGGFEALCTGTLLNDSDLNSDHQVLTANHCISTQSEAQSVTVYWNYNTGDAPPAGTPITVGANLLVTGTASDFTLLKLTGGLPAGLFFAGWDANPVSTSTSITGIHHPQGSHKRISFGATNANCASGLPGPCSNFTGVTWGQGTTEPGSSGSGLWTGTPANAMLVGTLTGGEASCTSPTGSDYYGRFSVTYPNVAGFLTSSCVSGIDPTSQSFSESGGTGSITVTAPAGCSWTASSTASFLTITSGASGIGPGTVGFSVAGNAGAQRSGSIVVGRQVSNVNQTAGGVCAPTPISLGQTINGTLSTSDCPLGDGSYLDAYSFNGTTGQQISVLMTSSAFDTFLYLLKPDGSVLVIDDDGGGGTNSRIPAGSGLLTLHATGNYTIFANSFAAGATGPYSLTFAGTAPPVLETLTVASSNPASGVNITVTPSDVNGIANGATQFTRTYVQNTGVTLFAPGTAGGNNFQKWQRDGVDLTTSLAANVVMDTNHTMTAIYVPPVTFVLTVASSNPDSGVTVSVTPNDNGGLGNGTTPFTRTYNQNANVNLNAPASGGVSTFWKWKLDGVDYAQSQFATITMNANHTATAIYVSPMPTPTPTPVPGAGAQRIAFVRQVTGNAGAEIFLTNVDGTDIVNLSNAQGDDTTPTWAPDGKRLAYTCRVQPDGSTNGPRRICVRNSDGTGFTVLSQTLAEDFGPVWSRDGSQIAFTTFNPGFQTTVYIMSVDGTGRRPMNLGMMGASNPDWSPDGRTIVCDLVNSVWNYNMFTQIGLRLTNATGDSSPRYSPDGSKIVFQSTRDGQAEIYVMNSSGTGQTRLTNNPASDTTPAWSPDGTSIVFTSSRDDPVNPALYVMNADGSNPTRVTGGSNGVWRAMSTSQFSMASYSVNEGDQRVTITVNRTGDTSNSSASVSYQTGDSAGVQNCVTRNGIASSRCDYISTVGTITFAAGETSKSFSVAIIDDSYFEGPETFTVGLNNPTGGVLGSQANATITITDNDSVDGPGNPSDSSSFFVRQQYLDFLNREPDASGFSFWTGEIENCTPKPQCTEIKRINVSAAFFLSIEFQETGYLVYRTYKAAYGNLNGTPVPLTLNEFLPDTQKIGSGVQVNVGNWQTQLENNKVAFLLDFAGRSRFVTAYPITMTPAQFVDGLFNKASVIPTASDRNAAINEFGGAPNTADAAARGRALRRVAENSILNQQENNKAFVLMQYFGYLRRNPNDAPEANLDFGGYNFWLGKLNQFNGNFVDAEMVKAFILSGEYRQRFGP